MKARHKILLPLLGLTLIIISFIINQKAFAGDISPADCINGTQHPTPTNPTEEIAAPKTGITVTIVNSLASLIPAIIISALALIVGRRSFRQKSL